MGKYVFWIVLTALVAGCSGGSGGSDEHDDEDGHSSVERHSNVAPGTCNTCHNGASAKGKDSNHISTTASCDTCHRTTGWEPATMNHNSVVAGTCSSCHNGTAARGKNSNHIATAAPCDDCHRTTGWIPATNGTPGISTIDFPVEAVFTSLASTASTFYASTTDAAGNSFSLSVSRTPGPDKTEPLIYPAPLKTYLQTDILRKNGNITSSKNFENFYSAAPLYLFGSLNNLYGSNNNMKVTTQLPLPTTSRTGSSGVFYKGRNYINNSTLSFDTWYATWSVEADSDTTAWLCLKVEITPATATVVSTAENDCFRINQAGDISGFKADITENGISLGYR